MGQGIALRLAVDLLHSPSRVRSLRSAPLPDDVSSLVRLASGDTESLAAAADLTGRSANLLQEAAGFFIEQVMLYPGADAYRVLGARPDATHAELRRNMAMLLWWLHPDGDQHGERVVFASRVTEAWGQLKTDDRRAAYDRSGQLSTSKRPGSRQRRSQRPKILRSSRPKSGPVGNIVPERLRYRPMNRPHKAPESSLFRRLLMVLFGRSVI